MTKKELRRQEWIARVSDYEASGQTMKAWCAEQGVTKDQLRYWLRTLNERTSGKSSGNTSNSFIPLTLSDSSNPTSSCIIVHAGAARLEVRSGFDAKLLHDVVSALTVSC
ncbi:IS66 family insertion sequence element accessory protein TnpA [Paenibacillus sp. YYML68]|uniref:IS66 family insertion sequence element accessory protein TnpA n=1 Tax=Paenibacillus sp. YYML68 TaxID=2909250 RepID=UPI0024932092|nr:IS66 family insertion sequence element accessory protein TnpB [Paenibacillus sp. YYML68]